VGKAKRAYHHVDGARKVGTLRFAHPTFFPKNKWPGEPGHHDFFQLAFA